MSSSIRLSIYARFLINPAPLNILYVASASVAVVYAVFICMFVKIISALLRTETWAGVWFFFFISHHQWRSRGISGNKIDGKSMNTLCCPPKTWINAAFMVAQVSFEGASNTASLSLIPFVSLHLSLYLSLNLQRALKCSRLRHVWAHGAPMKLLYNSSL